MRAVYDYKDIRQLDELPIKKQICDGIVITATSELARAMNSYYPDFRVYDIHSFISSIVPEWEQNVKDIKNYVILRNVIEEYLDKNDVSQEVATSLRRNTNDMWNAIKLLIEADVYPSDINDDSSLIVKHFKEVWKRFELDNEQVVAFKSIFSYELSQNDNVLRKIEDVIGEMKENYYLFGFYFITPLQDRIFDILENAGVKLHFMNCYNHNYMYAMKIWEKTFRQYESNEVVDLQRDIVLENYFGEMLNGNSKKLKLKIVKHESEFEFAEMVKSAVDRGETIYSPDARRCEKILKEYYPDYYDQKHLLSFPVGQYIYNLHMMWDALSNKMNIRFEYIYKCFASGWVVDGESNGKDYLYDLKKLEPFFKFCKSIQEWENRLVVLKEAKNATCSFNKRKKRQERWHELMGNPFTNLSVYSISADSIDIIDKLLHKLIEDANFLFCSDTDVDLYDHFSRISEVIKQHYDKDETLKDEQVIVKDLLNKLNDENAKGIKCPMNGIRDAIVLLIGDHYEGDESLDEETAYKDRMVLPLSMVESAMLDNYGERIHLVLADEFSLPGHPKSLPWPITNEMLDMLNIGAREKTKKYVRDMRSIIDNRPLSYRYLFYSFIAVSNKDNQPDICIEWISKDDKKEIDVSSYVKLLMPVISDSVRNNAKITKIIKTIKDSSYSQICYEPEMMMGQVPDEVRMDYLLCKRRYAYSYLLNYLPTYSSEFHYSFELTKLISSFSIVAGKDKETVSENMKELFPFLRHIELRQATDFATDIGKPEPVIFDGVEYPGQRLLPHYLDNSITASAQSKYDDYVEKGVISNELPDKACIYCPYANVCIDRYEEEVKEYE